MTCSYPLSVIISKIRGHHFAMYLYIVTACSSSAVMSLLASWSSPALAKLHGSLSVSEVTALEVGLPLGAALGVMAGWLAVELCGRKSMLLLGGFVSLIAWLLLGLGQEITLLCAGRITGGIAIGLINISSSLYIPEIAPPELRGVLFGVAQVFTNLGCLLEYSVGPFVSLKMLAGLSAIQPLCYTALCFLLPESPYHLVATDRIEKAEIVLANLRGNKDVAMELKLIEEKTGRGRTVCTGGRLLFSSRKHWHGALVVGGACLLKQVTGGVAVLSYAEPLFIVSGLTFSSSLASLLLGAVKTLGSCFTVLLAKKFSVKTLLLLSCYGVTFFLLTLAGYMYAYDKGMIPTGYWNWVPLFCIIMYFIFLDFGIGPFPSFLGGEVLEWKVQGLGVALSLTISHLVNVLAMAMLVGWYLPLALATFGLAALLAIPLLTFFMRPNKENSTSDIIVTRL